MGDFNHETSDLEWKKTWSFGLITDREKYKEKGMQDKRWTKTWPDLKLKCERETSHASYSQGNAYMAPLHIEVSWQRTRKKELAC